MEMIPADNSKFVLTNVMVRTLLVTVGGFLLSFAGFYLETQDAKKALIRAAIAAGTASGLPRFAEGMGLDYSRSVQTIPPVSPGDVAATSLPVTLD
jgi:hypothetical protein